MASIDGAPILFTFLSLVGLLMVSPLVSRSAGEWFTWMFGGFVGAVSGSILFMMAGGSDHAPRLLLGFPFLMAGSAAWFFLKSSRRRRESESET